MEIVKLDTAITNHSTDAPLSSYPFSQVLLNKIKEISCKSLEKIASPVIKIRPFEKTSSEISKINAVTLPSNHRIQQLFPLFPTPEPTPISLLRSRKPTSNEPTSLKAKFTNPNLGQEAAQLVVKVEENSHAKMREINNEIIEIQKLASKFLDLKGKIGIHLKDSEFTVTEDELHAFEQLRSLGIELLQPGETKITLSRLGEIMQSITFHLNENKTEIQKKFNELSVLQTELTAILDSFKSICRLLERVNGTILANSRK